MNRRALGILAILIIILMAFVATAGLDDLPRDLRARAEAVTSALDTDLSTVRTAKARIERGLQSEPDLFRARAADYRGRIAKAEADLASAAKRKESLTALVTANRREDGTRLRSEIDAVEKTRQQATARVDEITAEIDRWLEYKRNLPQQLASLQSDYDAIRAWDAGATSPVVTKAITDWPAKATDLQQRVSELTKRKEQADALWSAVEPSRQQAAVGNLGSVDFPLLFGTGDTLRSTRKTLAEGIGTIEQLAKQLYVDRSKVLLDLDDGDPDRQRVRVVETRHSSASTVEGSPSQTERWENINEARVRDLADNIGMVVERKPAGKYDSEAQLTPEAPAYAYVAPPGQSNQYGSWSNGVWQWLPQYLILSQLLRPSYPPISYDDYRGYQTARQRGGVWHGTDGRYRQKWGGGRTSGSGVRGVLDSFRRSGEGRGWYSERARREEPAGWGSSGYSGSKYRNRGSYSGSRYQSRGSSSGFGSRSYSRGGGFGGFRRGGRR